MDVGPEGSIRPLILTTPHNLRAHARQAVRPHIKTLGPGAVFGTQADVFYETPPMGQATINLLFMPDSFLTAVRFERQCGS